ncbi:MAG: ATP-binding protein [Silvanigrellales bacterium]|nr:ATP-binding protein [Silvanigrellales bacterium]
MTERTYWLQRVKEELNHRSVVWIAGVRRAGKTTLANAIPGARLFDCELPRVRAELADAEIFLRRQPTEGCLVLDEIHRLSNPSELLKIAADHFPHLRVVATGSTTLSAKKKFTDTLTGRKSELWLLPVLAQELSQFFPHAGPEEVWKRRLFHGGLPGFLLSSAPRDVDYLEWIDSFWAKDVQELFVVDKKSAFQIFLQLILRQSGELFEATVFAAPCEVSRHTILNYLSILETTLTAVVLRPYSGGSASELKSQPKVYAFDTGFVAWANGWAALSHEAEGRLLEHLVLETLHGHWPRGAVSYWRNKAKNEVDFILRPGRGTDVYAIECKSRLSKFDPAGMNAFRRLHPGGLDVVVALDAQGPQWRLLGGRRVLTTGPTTLAQALLLPPSALEE